MQTRKPEMEYSTQEARSGASLYLSFPIYEIMIFTCHSGFWGETPDEHHFIRLQSAKQMSSNH